MTIVGQPLLFCQSGLTFCHIFRLGMHFGLRLPRLFQSLATTWESTRNKLKQDNYGNNRNNWSNNREHIPGNQEISLF